MTRRLVVGVTGSSAPQLGLVLLQLLREALVRPTPRRATRPTLASKKRRLEGKKRRGDIKSKRGGSGFDD